MYKSILEMENRFTIEKVPNKYEQYKIYDHVKKVFTAHFMNGSTKESIEKYVLALNKKYKKSFEKYKREIKIQLV